MATVYRRVTVFAGRQVDATESTVLTGPGGAFHSDDFKITDHPNLAGWKPYLARDGVKIHRGDLDPLSARTTIGQFTVRMIDVRTNLTTRTMLERWVTAFLGDAKGQNQLLGNKAYAELSEDGGTTWQPDAVGRIDDTALDDPNHFQFTGVDLAADLDVQCFADPPASTATGVVDVALCPVGLQAAYAQQPVTTPLTGTVGPSAYTNQTNARVITLNGASQSRLDNIITSDLSLRVMVKLPGLGQIAGWVAGLGYIDRGSSLRCRLHSGVGSPPKELQVLQIIGLSRSDGHYAVKELLVAELKHQEDGTAATDDPLYTAFDTGTVANGTSLTLTLRAAPSVRALIPTPKSRSPFAGAVGSVARRTSNVSGAGVDGGGAVSDTPAIITGDLALMTFLGDLLDGVYSALYLAWEKKRNLVPSGKSVGQPKFPIPYDTTAGGEWDQLANATNRDPLPTSRWVVEKSWRRFDFIEKQFGQIYGIGYRFQPALLAGVPVSKFVPIDLRLPTAAALAGIPTITDDDLIADDHPGWSQGRSSAVSDLSVTHYNDVVITPEAVAALKDKVPTMPTSLLTPIDVTDVFVALGESRAIAIGSKPLAVDALGIRHTIDAADVIQGQQSQTYMDGVTRGVTSRYAALFGNGAEYIPFATRRTAVTRALWQGMWCYLAASVPPSAGINKRGDTRLGLIVGRQDDGPVMRFRIIALGAGAVCASPSIATPTQQTGNTNHGISAALTANAQADPMEVRYLIDTTKALTTPPAGTDPRWTFGVRAAVAGTYSLPNLPSSVRVFPQVRAVPGPAGSSTDKKLPSAWISPSGTKYVDTAATSAPTGLSVSPGTILTTSTITAIWTNPAGSVAFFIGIYLDGVLVTTLVPGTATVVLNPYTPLSSHLYTLDVKYFDGLTGSSAAASTTFTTPGSFTGGALTAPVLVIV